MACHMPIRFILNCCFKIWNFGLFPGDVISMDCISQWISFIHLKTDLLWNSKSLLGMGKCFCTYTGASTCFVSNPALCTALQYEFLQSLGVACPTVGKDGGCEQWLENSPVSQNISSPYVLSQHVYTSQQKTRIFVTQPRVPVPDVYAHTSYSLASWDFLPSSYGKGSLFDLDNIPPQETEQKSPTLSR